MFDVTASVYVQLCCPYLTTVINCWQTDLGGGVGFSHPSPPIAYIPVWNPSTLGYSAMILDSLPVLTYAPGSPESQQFSAIQSSVSVGM